MKVVFVTTEYLPHIGGIEVYIHDIAKELVKSGNNVTVIVADKNSQECSIDEFEGEKVIRLPSINICGFVLLRKRKYIEIIDKEISSANVVHLNACKFLYKHLAEKKDKYNYRLIVTSHGWLYHTNRYKMVKDFYFKNIVAKYAYKYDAIINVSIQDQRILEKFGVNNSIVILSGSDCYKYAGLKDKKSFDNIFMYLGRVAPNKGIYECLLKLKDYDKDFTFNIIGMCEDKAYMNKLESIILKYDLDNKVKFLGKRTDKEIRDIVENSDMILLPSLHEGFGLTLVEFLLSGRPIIANDIDSYRDILEKTNSTEYIFNYCDDKTKISDKIIDLQNKTIKPKCVEQFSVDTMVKNTINTYIN